MKHRTNSTISKRVPEQFKYADIGSQRRLSFEFCMKNITSAVQTEVAAHDQADNCSDTNSLASCDAYAEFKSDKIKTTKRMATSFAILCYHWRTHLDKKRDEKSEQV